MTLQALNEGLDRKPILKTIVSIKKIESKRRHWVVYEMTDDKGKDYQVNTQDWPEAAMEIFGSTGRDANLIKSMDMSKPKKIWLYPKNKFGYQAMRLTKEAKQ